MQLQPGSHFAHAHTAQLSPVLLPFHAGPVTSLAAEQGSHGSWPAGGRAAAEARSTASSRQRCWASSPCRAWRKKGMRRKDVRLCGQQFRTSLHHHSCRQTPPLRPHTTASLFAAHVGRPSSAPPPTCRRPDTSSACPSEAAAMRSSRLRSSALPSACSRQRCAQPASSRPMSALQDGDEQGNAVDQGHACCAS